MTERPCDHYCTHGGRCVLDRGHDGLHDTRYCQWPDTESLNRQAADEVLAGKPDGQDFLDTFAPLADLFEAMLDEEEP